MLCWYEKQNFNFNLENLLLSFILKNEMIQLFCHGQRKEFFRRWLQNIPSSFVNEDVAAQKLEFQLNIHFAIYPLRKGGNNVC